MIAGDVLAKKAISFSIEKRTILNVLLAICANLSVLTPSIAIDLLCISLLSCLIFTGDSFDDLISYIFLIPTKAPISIDGKSVFFIFLGISVYKLLLRGKIKLNKGSILYIELASILVFIELINDFGKSSFGNYISLVFYLIYLLIFINCFQFDRYRNKAAIIALFITTWITLLFAIWASGGNILVFMNEDQGNVRFGEDVRGLGGAMGIPLYCLAVICISIYQISYTTARLSMKVIHLLSILFAVIIGLITVSRVFILGLLVIICFLFLLRFKKGKSSIASPIIILAVMLIIVIFNLDFFNRTIAKYAMRFIANSEEDSRMSIYRGVISFLKTNPIALIMGSGAYNYVKIGKERNFEFAMMAHNLYLDMIMSWGLIGSTILISQIRVIGKRNARVGKVFNLPSSLLVVVLMVCYMTGGSFNYYNIYIYILVLFPIVYIKQGEQI